MDKEPNPTQQNQQIPIIRDAAARDERNVVAGATPLPLPPLPATVGERRSSYLGALDAAALAYHEALAWGRDAADELDALLRPELARAPSGEV